MRTVGSTLSTGVLLRIELILVEIFATLFPYFLPFKASGFLGCFVTSRLLLRVLTGFQALKTFFNLGYRYINYTIKPK
jgi:hypothetical protein